MHYSCPPHISPSHYLALSILGSHNLISRITQNPRPPGDVKPLPCPRVSPILALYTPYHTLGYLIWDSSLALYTIVTSQRVTHPMANSTQARLTAEPSTNNSLGQIHNPKCLSLVIKSSLSNLIYPTPCFWLSDVGLFPSLGCHSMGLFRLKEKKCCLKRNLKTYSEIP